MSNIDNNILLTPEIEAEMPKGLLPLDQYKWRRNKENELKAKAKAAAENQGNTQSTLTSSTPASDNINAEKSEATDKSAPETPVNDVLSGDNEETQAETKKEPPNKPTAAKKSKAASVKDAVPNKSSSEYKHVRGIHDSVLVALRQLFPGGAHNCDLISAAVYIITDGNCEISEQAMQLVNSYDKRVGDTDISERLSNIERMLRNNNHTLMSIELCTCYNTFDRRYGSKERRASPRETEFREQGNLDMLDRLRRQADDQLKVDSIERGREIYNLTKDKNDK